jgi:hypothetical protein
MGLGRQLAIFAFDIGAPIGCYYVLRTLGVSPLVALAVSAVPPALAAGWQLLVTRRIDPVAVLVLVTVAVSLVVSALTHDVRLLLAREGLLTGLWGLVFVGSVWARRPMAFTVARPLMEGRRAFGPSSWDELWAGEPAFRRVWRVSSVVWGVALLVDAIVRVVMSYTLPVDRVPALGGILWPVTLVVINVVTNVYYHRAGLYRMLGRG